MLIPCYGAGTPYVSKTDQTALCLLWLEHFPQAAGIASLAPTWTA